VASWLSTQTPEAISSITQKNPQIVPVLLRMVSNLAGKQQQQ
jgi:hypothetical protein